MKNRGLAVGDTLLCFDSEDQIKLIQFLEERKLQQQQLTRLENLNRELNSQIGVQDSLIYNLEDDVEDLRTILENQEAIVSSKDELIETKDKEIRRQRIQKGFFTAAGAVGIILILIFR